MIPDKDQIYLDNFNKIGNSKDNIIIIEDVISDSDHARILEYVSSADFSVNGVEEGSQWYQRIIGQSQMPQDIQDILMKVFSIVKLKIKNSYHVDLAPINPYRLLFTRWMDNVDMGTHVDDFAVYENHIASIYYVNDDYSGGEIYFPKHGISIKPKKNSVIIFPGNENYPHGVSAITDNVRYTSNLWFSFLGSTYVGRHN